MLRARAFVAHIAQHRMAIFGKMDANLIATPRFQIHFHQRRTAQALHDLKMRHRQLAFTGRGRRILIQVIVRSEETAKRAAIRLERPHDNRRIFAFGLAVGKLLLQSLRNGFRFGKTNTPDVSRSKRCTMCARWVMRWPLLKCLATSWTSVFCSP